MNNAVPALHLQGVCRSFQQGGARLDVLVDAGLTIATGEIVALVGPSGAGKSTLLQIAGLLERPDAGDVIVAGQACAGLNDDRRTALRKEHLGFVYQYHHLLPEFSAAENIILPQMINGRSRKQARERGDASSGQHGAGQTGRSPARPAFRRGTAAGGNLPGAGQCPEAAAG